MKRLVLLMIICIGLLIGCQKSELALKEQCSRFVGQAMMRWKEVDYKGTFYSKTKTTCVSIYWFNASVMDFYDEFTGTYFGLLSTEEGFKFQQSLNLVK